jgi:hypothetical protein
MFSSLFSLYYYYITFYKSNNGINYNFELHSFINFKQIILLFIFVNSMKKKENKNKIDMII